MRFYWLVLGILGVWQITDMLHARDGPWQSLRHLRALLGSLGLGKAVTCFYCLSVWVALPVAAWIGKGWREVTLLWFALAGAASLIERTTNRETGQPALYFEDAPDPVQQNAIAHPTEDNDHV